MKMVSGEGRVEDDMGCLLIANVVEDFDMLLLIFLWGICGL